MSYITEEAFISQKRKKSKEQLDKDYIEYCVKINKERKFKKSKEKDRATMLKRCQSCLDFNNEKKLLFCQFCQDAYHSYCLPKKMLPKSKPRNKECIICPKCKEQQKTMEQFFTKITNTKTIENTDDISDSEQKSTSIDISNTQICFKCKKKLVSDIIKNCEKCHQNFHLKCFKNKDTKIVCFDCEKQISNKIQTTKISNFFKTTKISIQNKDKSKLNSDFKVYTTITEKIMNGTGLPKVKCEGKLKLPKMVNDDNKKLMMESLFRALEVKKITFNDDLVYLDEDCPRDMNNAKLEPGIGEMSEYNKKIYESFKERSRKGIYAPIEVVDDEVQRFIVRAIDDIAMNTIICEYVGEVTLLRKKIFDNNDSIMELIRAPSSDSSLVICPEKYGNLARFLSGVNNFNAKLKKKQNVYSYRMSINGSVHILLVAMRNIKKGEILYYNYNGVYNGYPTQYFV